MLILPDDGQVDAEMLRDMVKEVNATQVAPAERLTNDIYHFDTKDHTGSINSVCIRNNKECRHLA